MGDPGNLGFLTDHEHQCIWLYTHTRGSDLPQLARAALAAAQPRWDDPPYATRMALTQLIGRVRGESGWGVDTVPGGCIHDSLVIDWQARRVILVSDTDTDHWGSYTPAELRQCLTDSPAASFVEFLAAAGDPVSEVWV